MDNNNSFEKRFEDVGDVYKEETTIDPGSAFEEEEKLQDSDTVEGSEEENM